MWELSTLKEIFKALFTEDSLIPTFSTHLNDRLPFQQVYQEIMKFIEMCLRFDKIVLSWTGTSLEVKWEQVERVLVL